MKEIIDLVQEDKIEGTVFNFLNDKKDKNGFKSYFTIVWVNGEHRFTATTRYDTLNRI